MSTVALGGDLGIETSTELKTRLAPLVDQAGDLTLDASQVSRIHTAAMQVLCAFVDARRQAATRPDSTVALPPSVMPRDCSASPRPSAWTQPMTT